MSAMGTIKYNSAVCPKTDPNVIPSTDIVIPDSSTTATTTPTTTTTGDGTTTTTTQTGTGTTTTVDWADTDDSSITPIDVTDLSTWITGDQS